MIDAELNVVSNEKITGFISSYNDCGNGSNYIGRNPHYKLYFSIIFNKQFEKSITWDSESSDEQVLSRKGKNIGVWLDFKNLIGNEVQVKVGISPISICQAEKEINTECPGWDFETIKNEASKSWEKKLRKIDIRTDRDDLKKLFYSLLYRSYTSPSVANASSGEYRPALKEETLKQTIDFGSGFTYYCGWDIWGNYRNKFGLIAITEPEVMRNVAVSILEYYRYRPNIVGSGYTFLPKVIGRRLLYGKNLQVYTYSKPLKRIAGIDSDDLNIAFEGIKQDYEEYPEHTTAFCLENLIMPGW